MTQCWKRDRKGKGRMYKLYFSRAMRSNTLFITTSPSAGIVADGERWHFQQIGGKVFSAAVCFEWFLMRVVVVVVTVRGQTYRKGWWNSLLPISSLVAAFTLFQDSVTQLWAAAQGDQIRYEAVSSLLALEQWLSKLGIQNLFELQEA